MAVVVDKGAGGVCVAAHTAHSIAQLPMAVEVAVVLLGRLVVQEAVS